MILIYNTNYPETKAEMIEPNIYVKKMGIQDFSGFILGLEDLQHLFIAIKTTILKNI